MDKASTKDMTCAELAAQIEILTSELQKKKSEAMDDLVSRFLSEANENQFSVDELLAKIQKKQGREPSKGRKKVAAGVIALTGFEKGVTYVNPEKRSEKWVAGKPGAKPKWLLDQFKEGMGPDEIKKRFSELKQPK
jgi:polyhydroxyalkanoate synthesis regulator phasin